MGIYVGREGVLDTDQLNQEVTRLAALYLDLERLRSGILPSVEELEHAPLIDNYMIVPREIPVLAGRVTDHPVLGSTIVTTSDLYVFAPDLGWARTLSRFYRLGSPSYQI